MIKILFYDIETSPNLAWVWGNYDQNVLKIERPWEILSVAWRWKGDNKVNCLTRDDFNDKSDRSLIKALFKLLDEADLVIAHNGINFDNKKTNTRVIKHKINPPSYYDNVDTLQQARRHFKFNSNRLDDLAIFLGLGKKVKTGGKELWFDCMGPTFDCTKGKARAWKLMRKYNKQDVILLEAVYEQMLPWIQPHPRINPGDPSACPACGSTKIESNGIRHNKVNSYKRYRCRGCGKSLRSRTTDKSIKSPNYV